MVAHAMDCMPSLDTSKILIGCNELSFSLLAERQLKRSRASQFKIVSDFSEMAACLEQFAPDVIVLHDAGNLSRNEYRTRVSHWRKTGYNGVLIVSTEDPSIEWLVQTIHCGVDGYLACGPHLSLDDEIARLLRRRREPETMNWVPDIIHEMGLFRSLGLTEAQIELLVEYARDFPRISILAERIEKPEGQLRKNFSRVYNKLRKTIAVDNQAQLAQLLTICATSG